MAKATQRLFFALWPDASISTAFAALAQRVAAESGGRPTTLANIHLTLAFLGEQPGHVTQELSAAASRIAAPAFDLVFDRVDSWRKNAIAWAGVQSVPAPLTELHQAVTRSLVASGIEPDVRPMAAHVTLARRIETSVQLPLAPPLVWRVSAFALVESELSAAGATYRVLRRWQLGAPS